MLETYIRVVGVLMSLISLGFIVIWSMQYSCLRKKDHHKVFRLHRLQVVYLMLAYMLLFTILMNTYGFSKGILMLFVGEIALLFLTDWIIEHLFTTSLLPLWSISQYLLIISFVVLARLNLDLGIKQFYMVSGAYLLAFITAFIYHKLDFVKYLGIPGIIVAVGLLLMTNTTINGANNWLVIGGFSFQPSEFVKILYILFLASMFVLFPKNKQRTILIAGIFVMALTFIQVFQKDLGSALIYYVIFILMCYVYTTNRIYIIGGGVVTLVAGYLAWLEFSHVRVRIEAWLNPWADIDYKGYQIAQSLFAIGNGGLTGAGLTLGTPNKVPVVTTDFIYSAIVEELGLIVGMAVIVAVAFIFLFAIQMIEKTHSDFDFLLGSGLVMVYGFQSFLIIGGVTRTVPLTGVTLPFVSYGGSSIFTTFILLGLLQGIKLSIKKHKVRHKNSERVS